jgi:UDP-N-acetylmuramate dehydrogenase
MSWWDEFPGTVRQGVSLAGHTTFGIGGPAEFFAEPRSPDELGRLVRRCHRERLPVRVLGRGSNVLVREAGVAGVVVRLSAPEFARVEVRGDRVRAGAGARLEAVISHAVRRGLRGLENLSGIPGTVGGAVRGNAGTREAEVAQAVASVTLLGPDGEVGELPGEAVRFGYRQSELGDAVVLAATFRLEQDEAENVARRRRECWRRKKGSQPLAARSAGCVFKNPPGTAASLLLDRAGLKGTRVGGARVSEVHANFIVAEPGASGDNVLHLMDVMRRVVRERFAIDLEPEVVVW